MDTNEIPPAPTPVAPVPQPYVSVMPKRRMNPAAVAGVVIAVALVGYGAYAYFTDSWPFAPVEPMASESPSPSVSESVTPDPMAGWKTYTNSTLGLELKYPSDFSVKEDTCTGRNCYTRLENGFALLKIRANNPGSGAISVSKNSETGTVSIGGIPATYRFGQEIELGDESRPLQTWALVTSFTHGQDQYDLAFEYNEAHPGVYKEQVMLPLLSTFRFMTPDPTTGWKTYTNTQYGFEFKHPSDWNTQSIEIRGPLNGYKYVNAPGGTSYLYNAQQGTWSPSGEESGAPVSRVTTNGTKWFHTGIADGLGGAEIALIPSTRTDVMIQISVGWGSCGAAVPCGPQDPADPSGDAADALVAILSTFKFTK